jgi:hypothetical protein
MAPRRLGFVPVGIGSTRHAAYQWWTMFGSLVSHQTKALIV